MCDDIEATLAELRGKGAEVAREVSDQVWGLLAAIRLPDGSEFPIYQPRHPSPLQPRPFGPADRPWGMRTVTFADPGGHIWEIAQELPGDAG
ncbi:MAG: hypothetical protein ACRDRJ_07680 [Streptosporangiaceae bacterium]